MSKKYLRDGRAPIPKSESTSRVMSANKGKDTKPEVLLRKELFKNDIRGYRLHWKKADGRPDIAFVKYRKAIFINGCFWHRCPYCKLSLPKSNQEFWKSKFEKNTERDKRKIQALNNSGWKTLVIWECEIKKELPRVIDKVKTFLNE